MPRATSAQLDFAKTEAAVLGSRRLEAAQYRGDCAAGYREALAEIRRLAEAADRGRYPDNFIIALKRYQVAAETFRAARAAYTLAHIAENFADDKVDLLKLLLAPRPADDDS